MYLLGYLFKDDLNFDNIEYGCVKYLAKIFTQLQAGEARKLMLKVAKFGERLTKFYVSSTGQRPNIRATLAGHNKLDLYMKFYGMLLRLQKRLFLEPYFNIHDPVEIDLMYHQSVTDVFEEKIPLTKQDAVRGFMFTHNHRAAIL